MQNNVVMAFRKRAKNRGYTEIQIYRVENERDLYLISAVEPLFHRVISGKMSLLEMHYCWR